jgi:ATP-dependent Clp protease, protease subunit
LSRTGVPADSIAQFPFGVGFQQMPGVLQAPSPAVALGASVVIKFFTEVNPATAQQLMQAIDNCVQQGVQDLLLLLSTQGGSVHHGVSLYHYLKGIPINVSTHNFGSVDSIGVVIFAAGRKRYSVPEARFLVHRVSLTIQGQAQLGMDQLKQLEASLQADQHNIARIIGANSNKTEAQVLAVMNKQPTLFPAEMKRWELVHEVRDVTFLPGANLLTIQ